MTNNNHLYYRLSPTPFMLPYLVEDQLNKNGAIALNKSSLEDKHAVVINQRLVSSMLLPSFAALVAKEVIFLLEN